MADNTDRRRSSTTTTTFTTTSPPITTTTTSSPHSDLPTTTSTTAPFSTTITHPTVTTTHHVVSPPERRPSIRIRRHEADQSTQTAAQGDWQGNRRRSSSEPQRPHLAAILQPQDDDLEIRRHVTATPLQSLPEEGVGMISQHDGIGTPAVPPRNPRRPAWGRAISLRPRAQTGQAVPQTEYEPQLVDMLDVIGR